METLFYFNYRSNIYFSSCRLDLINKWSDNWIASKWLFEILTLTERIQTKKPQICNHFRYEPGRGGISDRFWHWKINKQSPILYSILHAACTTIISRNSIRDYNEILFGTVPTFGPVQPLYLIIQKNLLFPIWILWLRIDATKNYRLNNFDILNLTASFNQSSMRGDFRPVAKISNPVNYSGKSSIVGYDEIQIATFDRYG